MFSHSSLGQAFRGLLAGIDKAREEATYTDLVIEFQDIEFPVHKWIPFRVWMDKHGPSGTFPFATSMSRILEMRVQMAHSLLVVNGWDELSTDPVPLVLLFQPF